MIQHSELTNDGGVLHNVLADNGHGPIRLIPTRAEPQLRQRRPERKATGLPAVVNSFKYAISEAGIVRGTLPLLQLNQKDGFDCPGCAWPDPDGKRSAFDFCENGAKAVAHESDSRRITADFFAQYSVAELSTYSDYWLEQQGRLTEPMVLRAGATHYQPIPWGEAFDMIATSLNSQRSPDEASFYTSGKAVNEAAFAYQLFARQFGTNNLPDCSNMCHESSGAALTNTLGFGKGTVTLEDLENAELIFVVGQNPGTNHPRQLTALQHAKRKGAKIIAVNPLPEAGLISFMNPQETLGMLGVGTKLADLFLQVKINGDVPLFKGILKTLVERDDVQPGAAINWGFVHKYTTNIDDLRNSVRQAPWEDLEQLSGVSRAQMSLAADWVCETERIVICWCLGVTQHQNGAGNVQELVNLLLLRGAMGMPGAGACCVRGHSNVQGDRTMGVWERPAPEFLDRLRDAFQFEPPRRHGLDAQRTAKAMHRGRIKTFISLGGNYLMALSDTQFTADALQRVELTVRIGTKLNRADLVTGEQALLLPCLGRTEIDFRSIHNVVQEQFTSTENSMGVVQWSRGRFTPASSLLLGETEIVCRIAAAALGAKATVDWLAWGQNYDYIRAGIAKVIPGCAHYNRDVRKPGGFYLPNPPRERKFPTATGKALFTVNPAPERKLEPNQLLLTTIRSHDQFNTTIYGLHDRYRGLHNTRRVVLVNAADLRQLGLIAQQKVNVTSHFAGQTRTAYQFTVVEYPIPAGCAAMYYPEANVLAPIDATDMVSNCPAFKSLVITLAATPA
ncbi:FdhF/YdeP family oxidoreductase [Blastopirellula marina]|uniref:Putative formate dehydrogenase n=1 Tax=Blastopirellula marina DSM 3645 TaxID=314230 RepID=A3ZYB7_9BACT|nr:FdhF/YdeP family oxidoreductase [Blastopirellula marina]EAQ78514.1 putative formate dehydrogenase [Blastopirellula marina DSM 3645]